MIAMKWPHSSDANEAMHARLADASDALAATLRSANEALAQSRAAGVGAARAIGDDMIGGARRFGRSTQDLVAERPVEALLAMGALAFALGWIARRARELRTQDADARPVASRSRPRKRTRAG